MKTLLLLATRNRGKLEELQALLDDLPVRIEPVTRLAPRFSVRETGATFEENALLKARAARDATGYLALADDSGLEVDALQGGPGVHSARYAGTRASDADNNEKLLRELSDAGDAERRARFVCVLALAHPDKRPPHLVRGVAEGRVLREPRGSGGFGYDPLFLCEDLGRSFAELLPHEKQGVSHRARALRALRSALDGLL